jgi:[acyl-carrier-protein] S-malonyltransferase
MLKAKGAKRAIKLSVGGAFHSPVMEPARIELEEAIRNTFFNNPICPVYQNVNAKPCTDPEEIKSNLVLQLTSPVRWTQSVINMIAGGATSFVEVGPGNVLQGLIKKINKDAVTEGAII